MGSYSQWRASVDRGEVRRVTWICGDQRVLVEEVVDTIRGLLVPSTDLDYTVFHGGFDADKEIWAAANQFPLTPGASKLILVRDAEKVTNWAPLAVWFDNARTLAGVHLVFVSNEPDLPPILDSGKKVGVQAHVDTIHNRRRLGQIVRCTLPNEADAVAWVRRRANLDEQMARYLLTRVGGNLMTAAGVCAKLKLFPGQAGPTAIHALCNESPAESFVDSLVLCQKTDALVAIGSLSDRDFGRALSQLDVKLDLMSGLWKSVRTGVPTRETNAVPVFLVKKYSGAARHYDPQRCAYRRRVLAVVDDAYRSGARVALMEALVALW